jgi:hypothetical protein
VFGITSMGFYGPFKNEEEWEGKKRRNTAHILLRAEVSSITFIVVVLLETKLEPVSLSLVQFASENERHCAM